MRPKNGRSVDSTPTTSANAPAPRTHSGSDPGGGALVRLGWMLLGPVLLVVSAFTIAAAPRWTFGVSDAVLALGAVLSIGFRWWDIAAFDGQTANGQPATMAVFRRYAVGLAIVVSASWFAAQSVHV